MSPAAEADARAVADVLAQIDRAWLHGRPHDVAPLLHPAITMVLPGWAGRVEGRDANVAGFVDFCENAGVESYQPGEVQVDVAGETAVASFAFQMVYARDGARWRSTGRDLWVFERAGGQWLATWRTMLDVAEEPAE
jgi:uncharacterized protein (TIGR02246 family)